MTRLKELHAILLYFIEVSNNEPERKFFDDTAHEIEKILKEKE